MKVVVVVVIEEAEVEVPVVVMEVVVVVAVDDDDDVGVVKEVAPRVQPAQLAQDNLMVQWTFLSHL